MISAPASPETGAVPERRPSEARLYVLLALMAFFWSLNFIIAKIALRELPALLVAAFRTGISGLILLPIYFCQPKERRDWKWADFVPLLLLGTLGVPLNQLFFVLGVERTSVGHGALMIALTPILVLLIAAAVGQERITANKTAGLLTALIGVGVLQVARGNGGGATAAGDGIVLLASLTFALFTVLGKRFTANHTGVVVNTFAYVGGGLALAPFILGNIGRFPFGSVSAAAWLSVLYMAVFPSVVSYLIYYYALTYIPASRVSAMSYLQPLLATLMAIPMLHERADVSLLAGGALVLTGVCVAERA